MSEGPSKKKGTKLAKDNPTVPKFTLFSNSDQGKQKPLNKQTDGAKASEQTAPLAASNKPCARILKSQLDEMRPTGVAKSTTSAKLLEDVAAQVSQIAAGTKAWSDNRSLRHWEAFRHGLYYILCFDIFVTWEYCTLPTL